MSETIERVWDGRGDALSDARMTQADARMADDLRLKLTHFRVMAHVGRQNNRRGWLRVSQSELAERWGNHRNTVNAAFVDLVGWGYLLQRTQEEAGESFCQYKVALDGEADGSHFAPVQAKNVSQRECSPQTAPPCETSGDEGGVQPTDCTPTGGECSPQTAHVHSGGVHPCTVGEYTPHIIPRAHRLSPTIAEGSEEPPLPPQAGGQDVSRDLGSGDGHPEGQGETPLLVRLLVKLEAVRPHDPFIVRVLRPLLAKRRFSAADPFAALAAACERAKGLPTPHLDKVLGLLLDADVKAIKADRLTAAIDAVRKGGLMLVVAKGSAEFSAWLRHTELTNPPLAAVMSRSDKWQVPAAFPPPDVGASDSPAGSRPDAQGPALSHGGAP